MELENQQPLTFRDRVLGIVTDQFNTQMFQIIKSVGLTISVIIGGIPGLLVTGAAVCAATWYRSNKVADTQKTKLLKLYRHEISEALHKNADALTIDDLEKAATIFNQLGDNPVSHELDIINKNAQRSKLTGLITNLVVMASSALMSASISSALINTYKVGTLLNIANGFIGSVTHATAEEVAISLDGKRPSENVNRTIDYVNRVLQTQPLQPEQLLTVMVAANPPLVESIKKEFGDYYQNLPLSTKKTLLKRYDEKFSVTALTEAINTQKITPAELGFIAYSAGAGLLPAVIQDTMNATPEVQSDFAKRITTERAIVPCITLH